MNDIVTFPAADYYGIGDSYELTQTDPLDAIEDALERWASPGCDMGALIREHGAMIVRCYMRGAKLDEADEYGDYEYECDEIGAVVLSADQTEALMREENPEWFEVKP